MDRTVSCASVSQGGPHNLVTDSEWPTTIPSNSNNSTLLYIAVEYVKNETKEDTDITLSPCDNFSNFQHVSILDPNMSSVARYSPVYNDQNYNPVIINQMVDSNVPNTTFINNLNTSTSLDTLPTVLCNNEDSQYLQQIVDDVDNVNPLQNSTNQNKEQEVEILLTDQATGITYYSVSTQELSVEEQHLLEALSPNPLLDSELLTIDESTLKNNLPEDLIDTNVNAESNMVTNFINNFTVDDTKDEEYVTNEDELRLRNRNSPTEIENEEKLLSPVYSIIDKPIPTRAWASLPETYLKIIKVENGWGVFSKKCIRKRTQFGPVQGLLKKRDEVHISSDKLELLIIEDEEVNALDISNESESNWMCFIRKAENYEEQNLVVTQYEKNLYFTVIRNILPKEELKVGYSYSYANQHNFQALEKELIEDEQWPCFECTEQFPTSQDLQNHLDLHEENKNDKIKFRKRIRRNRRKFIKVATEACQCRICQQVFNPIKYGVLKNHLLTKHNMFGNDVEDHFFIVRNYKCDKCSVVFNSESLFKIHNLQHNADLNDDNSDDETYHICPSCNRKFPTQRQLISHVSNHSLPKFKRIPERFQCPVCYSSYPMRERLQRHMLVHGPEESKPFQCHQCKKRFMNNSALTCHLKTHSSGENIYECPICKESFNHVPKLKMHVQLHCIDNMYTCPHCNKKFKAYNIIRKHIRAFHSERKYSCQHCTKFFPTICKLKMHLLKHSDHREFLCADCGKQFKRRDKLTEHCKRVHFEERENNVPVVKTKTNEKTEVKKFVPRVEPTDFHRFIYKCNPCLIGFKRRGMLVNHLAKRHPDISLDSVPELNLPILRATKDYYCQYCDKVYKSSSKRKAHILKNHPGAALPISNRKQGAYPEVAGLPNPTFSQTVGSVTTAPQNCTWCHKQYASKAKLLQHQRKEHVQFLEQTLDDCNTNVLDDGMLDSPGQSGTDNIQVDQLSEYVESGKILTANVMEEFIDDPDNDNQYCHLVNVTEHDVFQQDENLNLPNSHLYRLLTNANLLTATDKITGLVPPR